MMKIRTWRSIFLENLSTYCLMLGIFFNPFGFDIVQYQLIMLTGNLWYANLSLYCIAGLFFILYFVLRRKAFKC